MHFPDRNITLRDGRAAILRAPAVSDAAALLDYMRLISAETNFVIRYPEEITLSVEAERDYIERVNASENDVMIVCEVGGDIAGCCSVAVTPHIKLRHRGSVAVALCRAYWGQGIGTAMFAAMADAARQTGLYQLELAYIEGNDRARRLYDRAGFTVTGELPDAVRLKDGTLLKEITMVKRL